MVLSWCRGARDVGSRLRARRATAEVEEAHAADTRKFGRFTATYFSQFKHFESSHQTNLLFEFGACETDGRFEVLGKLIGKSVL